MWLRGMAGAVICFGFLVTACGGGTPEPSDHEQEQEVFERVLFRDRISPVETHVFPGSTVHRFSVNSQFDMDASVLPPEGWKIGDRRIDRVPLTIDPVGDTFELDANGPRYVSSVVESDENSEVGFECIVLVYEYIEDPVVQVVVDCNAEI